MRAASASTEREWTDVATHPRENTVREA
jgi:hypothetical protein